MQWLGYPGFLNSRTLTNRKVVSIVKKNFDRKSSHSAYLKIFSQFKWKSHLECLNQNIRQRIVIIILNTLATVITFHAH